MGWRFHRSVKILPGVRLNFNKSSTSISIGGRGFHKTISSTGRVTNTVGIPGTGLYYTQTHSRNTRQPARTTQTRTQYIPQQEVYTGPSIIVQDVPAVDFDKVRSAIQTIYKEADTPIDWQEMLLTTLPDNQYFHDKAEDILDGDIDTYFQVINDLNPMADLMEYGSEFECGTDDPRMLSVHFLVNSDAVLKDAKKLPANQYHDLLQDYVCGCAIRIARDMFALLPLRSVIVDARDKNKEILSVEFTRREFLKLDFAHIDASDTVSQFNHRMAFTLEKGFLPIIPIDDKAGMN